MAFVVNKTKRGEEIMRRSAILSVTLMLTLPGCSYFSGGGGGCNVSNVDVDDLADRQEQKLKRYFMRGGRGMADISTLISETRSISARLKASGQRERANRFDSYIDVLTYGNRTIDESIRDAQRLVKNNDVSAEGESKLCNILNRVFP